MFDFGGSTCNVTVICASEGDLDVKGTGSDLNLGGRDIDECLVKFCMEEFNAAKNIDLSEDRYRDARKRLAIECERVKIILSEESVYEIRVSSIAEDEDLCFTMTREKLEEIAETIFEGL